MREPAFWPGRGMTALGANGRMVNFQVSVFVHVDKPPASNLHQRLQGVAGGLVPGSAAGAPRPRHLERRRPARPAAGHRRWAYGPNLHFLLSNAAISETFSIARSPEARGCLQRLQATMSYALCAGADGSMKVWSLEDHLPLHWNAFGTNEVPDGDAANRELAGRSVADASAAQQESFTLQHKVMPRTRTQGACSSCLCPAACCHAWTARWLHRAMLLCCAGL